MSVRLETNRKPALWRAGEPWRRRMLRTPLRCHVVGGTVAIALLFATAQVWLQPSETTLPHHPSADVADHANFDRHAVATVSQPRTRNRALREAAGRKLLAQRRVAAIGEWLPHTIAPERVRQTIHDCATEASTRVDFIRVGTSDNNDAIAITPVRCRVVGSFRSIYQLLESLAGLPQPFHCAAIEVIRRDQATHRSAATDDTSNDASDPSATVLVTATLDLIVPHAGHNTLADRLYRESGMPAQRDANETRERAVDRPEPAPLPGAESTDDFVTEHRIKRVRQPDRNPATRRFRRG